MAIPKRDGAELPSMPRKSETAASERYRNGKTGIRSDRRGDPARCASLGARTSRSGCDEHFSASSAETHSSVRFPVRFPYKRSAAVPSRGLQSGPHEGRAVELVRSLRMRRDGFPAVEKYCPAKILYTWNFYGRISWHAICCAKRAKFGPLKSTPDKTDRSDRSEVRTVPGLRYQMER